MIGRLAFIQFSFVLDDDLTPGKWHVGSVPFAPAVTPTYPIGIKGLESSVSGWTDLDGTQYVENESTVPRGAEIRLNYWYRAM